MIPSRVISTASRASGIISVMLLSTNMSVVMCIKGCELSGGTYTASQGFQSLLLGMGVNVGADNETDDVEEWHPGLFGQEFLGECKA